jgi:predicted acyl esterase
VLERDVTIATPDAERLATTLYLPDGGGPFGAVIDALPYRKDDVTESYRSTYHRYAEHGLAVLRVDLRGTGSSSGTITDEYSDAERADLRTAIGWITDQPWSNGNVGMFGTSYGGFNSLHMAADDVAALKAIVPTYATDDRYTDDVHYCGGVLRQLDLVDYPTYMVAMNALPPVPAVFGEGWREEWQRRIDGNPPWVIGWLEHATDSAFWRRGSIRLGPDGDGYDRISAATMLIVGWADGYRNNSFRVVEQFERNGQPWRLLAGPWVHKSPETARPGPNVHDDADVLAFFHHHLAGGPPIDAARGQVYVRQPAEPEPDLAFHPGRWVDIDTWPPAGLSTLRLTPEGGGIDSLAVEADVGVAAWNSCGGGLPWGQPLDQRADNARSLRYDWPITERAELVGIGRVRLRVRSDQRYGHVSVKLCDVLPTGRSALITRGMLDLRHRGCWPADPNGAVGGAITDLVPGEWIEIDIELESTTWTLEPGHTLRLAVAGTDWPNCWPPPGPLTIGVDRNLVRLELPIVELPASTHQFIPGTGPSDSEADGVEWRIEHDVLARETRAHTRYGGTYEGLHGAVTTDDYRGSVGVSTLDPARAWARGAARYEITWPEATVRTESTVEVTSDAERFEVTITLGVWDGDHQIADKSWHRTFAR